MKLFKLLLFGSGGVNSYLWAQQSSSFGGVQKKVFLIVKLMRTKSVKL